MLKPSVATCPSLCQTITPALHVSYLTLSLAQIQDWMSGKQKQLSFNCASERVTKVCSTFLLEVATMKAVHSDCHSLVHAVIAAHHFSLTCSLFTYQNAKSAANREVKM